MCVRCRFALTIKIENINEIANNREKNGEIRIMQNNKGKIK